MDHHKVDFENVARVVGALGLNGFKKLSGQMPAYSVKYAGLTLGEAEAIFNALGDANMKKILSGQVSIEVKELVRKLADKNGRIIPYCGMINVAKDPDTNFKLVQPEINYAERLTRLIRFFPDHTFLPVEEFQKRSKALLYQLQKDARFSNLLNGVWLPVCYPQHKLGDYGKDLGNIFFKAVGESYEERFPERKFSNQHKGNMRGRVGIVDASHKRFLAKMAEGPVVGIQFFPLQGFSICADRELMLTLPESLVLSGPIDIAVAMTAYPDVLVRDYWTPGYDCAAVDWINSNNSIFLKANEDDFVCVNSDNLRDAFDDYSGGLVFIG